MFLLLIFTLQSNRHHKANRVIASRIIYPLPSCHRIELQILQTAQMTLISAGEKVLARKIDGEKTLAATANICPRITKKREANAG